jgi:RNA polymerase sigma-70 factor (ECF subfamily)
MYDDEKSAPFTGWVTRLARAHTKHLRSIASSEGLSAHDAIDAVQEAFVTFLSLPQARELVGAPDDSRAVMVAIVRNAARNQRRRHYRSRPHADTELEFALSAGDIPADELVAQAELHVQLSGCVGRLAEVQRQVVRLRALEELSAAEVAQELGLDPRHVAVLLHRAKRALARCLSAVKTDANWRPE